MHTKAYDILEYNEFCYIKLVKMKVSTFQTLFAEEI